MTTPNTDTMPPLPEPDSFGELLCCAVCGSKPYAYDMRGTDTHEICTVECDSCNHSVAAETRAAAALKWNAGRCAAAIRSPQHPTPVKPALWAPEGLEAHEGTSEVTHDCERCCLSDTALCTLTPCTSQDHPSGRPVYFTVKP